MSNKNLEKLYFDPKNPLGLGSIRSLYLSAQKSGLKVTENDVKRFLMSQQAYTLVKKRPKKSFKRTRYIISDLYDIFQSDLADMQSLAKYNDGYKYIMVVINCFSKFCWAKPLKTKKGVELSTFLGEIFDTLLPEKPKNFIVDKAKEHYSHSFTNELKSRGIKLMYTNNDESHAVFAERKILDIKRKIYMYLRKNNTWRYVDKLQHIVDSLNRRKVRTTGFRPIDVNRENENEVRRNLYPKTFTRLPRKYKFEVGDRVKLLKRPFPFPKSFYPHWTEEEFFIDERIPSSPPTYRIKAINGEAILGIFYEPELQKVYHESNEYEIEKILKTRKSRGGTTEYLVKWKGYPAEQASWVVEKDIKKL